jgi:hypothetical protein
MSRSKISKSKSFLSSIHHPAKSESDANVSQMARPFLWSAFHMGEAEAPSTPSIN